MLFYTVVGSIADPNPDPPDPHVFGPPGSGSFYQQGKISKKNLDSYCFVPSLGFLSLKNDMTVGTLRIQDPDPH